MIDSYAFGKIIIAGRTYSADLIIYPDGRIRDSWWRARGHELQLSDLADLLDTEPETIVAGTGAMGLMRPAAGLEGVLQARNIEFLAARSGAAVELYNKLLGRKKLAACFHLTC